MDRFPPPIESPWADWDVSATQRPALAAATSAPSNILPSPDSWSHIDQDLGIQEIPDEPVDPWEDAAIGKPRYYSQGSTIDWMYEEAAERSHKRHLKSQVGIRGIIMPLFESWRLWAVLIFTGISIGYIGGMLDLLVAWLSDLRMGRCSYGVYYNQSACCSGLEVGEICREWVSWSEYFHIKSMAGQAVLQSIIYIALAVCFATSAAILVSFYAPYAFHTGIPEIKAILGGYVLDEFLSPWTLLIKALGLALSVASGLSLGKEGPLVHVSCCMASALLSLLSPTASLTGDHRQNQSQRRKILAAAASAGVAVAFGSPLGGVLFGLEELDSTLFSNEQLMWRAFVTSVVAATTLAYVDPFGMGKLVLFQVTTSQQWRQFELIPWLGLGVAGGALGALLIKLNVQVALFRRRTILKDNPLAEVAFVAAVTALLSWPIVFMRDQTSTLVANLFLECDPNKDYHGLCNPASMPENMVLLILTAALKVLLTGWTFGLNVPAGIFLPTIAIGASLGRTLGIFLQQWHQKFPHAWIFSACPPEGTCIYPGFYAVIGAAALLGGVTRMTVSLVVILFELTGALSHVLPIMLAVMASKFVGDYFGKGIYDTWIAMHGYPHLNTSDFRDRGETAASIMTPVANVVTINGRHTLVTDLDAMLEGCDYDGFPVLDGDKFIGYVTRHKLREAIDGLLTTEGHPTDFAGAACTFLRESEGLEGVNLSSTLEQAPMQMRKEMPLQIVVSMFQKLNLRYVLFTSMGRLTGLLTKRDVVRLLAEGFDHVNALSRPEDSRQAEPLGWSRFW